MATEPHEVDFGTIALCTIDDYVPLAELYRTAYPEERWGVLSYETDQWMVYRDGDGQVRVAMMGCREGSVLALARPGDDSPETKRAFVLLAKQMRRYLAPYGVTSLAIMNSPAVERLCSGLEREGFLGKGIVLVRAMRFTEAGELQRVE